MYTLAVEKNEGEKELRAQFTEALSSESDAIEIVKYLLDEIAPKFRVEKKREIKMKRKVIKLSKERGSVTQEDEKKDVFARVKRPELSTPAEK